MRPNSRTEVSSSLLSRSRIPPVENSWIDWEPSRREDPLHHLDAATQVAPVMVLLGPDQVHGSVDSRSP